MQTKSGKPTCRTTLAMQLFPLHTQTFYKNRRKKAQTNFAIGTLDGQVANFAILVIIYLLCIAVAGGSVIRPALNTAFLFS
jgi:hypothetical protein